MTRAFPRTDEVRSSGWSGSESPFECNCDFPNVGHALTCPLRQEPIHSKTQGETRDND